MSSIKIRQDYYGSVIAKFEPSEEHRDSLREEYNKFIGETLEFYSGWIAEDDEQFAGERIFLPKPNNLGFNRWVPESDLKIIKVLEGLA